MSTASRPPRRFTFNCGKCDKKVIYNEGEQPLRDPVSGDLVCSDKHEIAVLRFNCGASRANPFANVMASLKAQQLRSQKEFEARGRTGAPPVASPFFTSGFICARCDKPTIYKAGDELKRNASGQLVCCGAPKENPLKRKESPSAAAAASALEGEEEEEPKGKRAHPKPAEFKCDACKKEFHADDLRMSDHDDLICRPCELVATDGDPFPRDDLPEADLTTAKLHYQTALKVLGWARERVRLEKARKE